MPEVAFLIDVFICTYQKCLSGQIQKLHTVNCIQLLNINIKSGFAAVLSFADLLLEYLDVPPVNQINQLEG